MSSGDILEQSGCEYLKCQYAGRKDGEPTCGYPGGFCPYRDDDNLELGEPDILPKVKPLRWRTGPVPREQVHDEFFVRGKYEQDKYAILEGFQVGEGEKYIPLSEILERVE